MQGIAAVLLFVSAASAQSLYDPANFHPRLQQALQNPELSPQVPCEVIPIRPMLNFGFRYQAGYVTRVPLKYYTGSGHAWAMIAKVTPEEPAGAPPVYLVDSLNLNTVPETKMLGQSGGGYLLGEGKYSVEWTLYDDSRRICRKSWKIHVEPVGKVKSVMPPNTVSELSLRGPNSAQQSKDDVKPIRLTIMLHAAPMSPRRTRLRPSDPLTLLSGVSSLLERVPTTSVRLIVFNMDQQQELYRQDGFALDSLDKVAEAINSLELGVVNYAVLQQRHAPAQFLGELMEKEISSATPSDVVLFLGPPSRYGDKVEQKFSPQKAGAPYFYHFEFQLPFRRQTYPDLIRRTVGKVKGKSISVFSPQDFAKAIEQLERRANDRQ